MANARAGSARGIYELDFLSCDGFPVLLAITSDNRRVAERVVWPFEDRDQVIADLREALRAEDPRRNPWGGHDD